MILELVVIAALLVGGVPAAAAAGVRGPASLAVGFTLGSAIVVSVGALLVMLGFSSPPQLVLSVTAGIGLLVGWQCRPRIVAIVRRPSVLVLICVVLASVAMLWGWGAVNLTPDSYRYVTTGALLAEGKLGEATGSLLLSRGLAVPLLHSPANLIGEFHLRSLTPMFAIATVGLVLWSIRVGLSEAGSAPGTIMVVQVVAAALLVSIHRFVFHAFYVNGHLFLAGWMLLLASSIWLRTTSPGGRAAVTAGRCLLVTAIVLARPDGALLVALVLVPLLSRASMAPWVRFAPLGTLGVVTLGWNLTIARAFNTVPLEVRFLILGGALVILIAGALVVWPGLLPRPLPPIAEIALWAAVVVASVRRPDILKDSVRATIDNVLLDEGGWGISLGVLGVLVLLVLIVSVDPSRSALRFPVTAFVPLSILLAFLREGAYRVGPGDSLSRMLIQIVPLAVLLLASAVAAPRWRGFGPILTDGQGSPTHDERSADVR